MFWRKVLDESHRERLVQNVTSTLSLCRMDIQDRLLATFGKVDKDFASRVSSSLTKFKKGPRANIGALAAEKGPARKEALEGKMGKKKHVPAAPAQPE